MVGALIGPSHNGSGLVNLVSEIEQRLTGEAPESGLRTELAREIPTASSYVLVLIDGLGDRQIDHPSARSLQRARVGALDAPFPSTTTVSMSVIVTGTSPASNGVIGHLMWLPEVGRVVNTLKWVDLAGTTIVFDTATLLPAPNLWERVRKVGIEPITIQPGGFEGTPLTNALYRGCRFVGAESVEDFVWATVEAVGQPGRLVFTYLPPVDWAAHVNGLGSPEYAKALEMVSRIWDGINAGLPRHAVMIGTADHGIAGIDPEGKLLIRDNIYLPLEFWGDPRALMVRGSERLIKRLAGETGAEAVWPERFEPWLGPGPDHRQLRRRLPDAILLAGPGTVLLPRGFDKRLVGYHGGLSAEEIRIPLLVAGG